MENKEYVLNSMKKTGLEIAVKLQEEAPELDGTALIDQEDYIPAFDPDVQYLNWLAGMVVQDGGQVWQLIQPYDSTIYKDKPENMRTQWGLCHTKDPKKAKPYVEALGQSGVYMADECCIAEDGNIYKSLIDNNIWKPTEYPTGWQIVEV